MRKAKNTFDLTYSWHKVLVVYVLFDLLYHVVLHVFLVVFE